MKSLIANKKNKVVYTLMLIGFFFLILAVGNYLIKSKIYYQPKAENQCGCTEGGSCSLNGQYCENFLYCENNTPIVAVYICSKNQWTFAYPQAGAFCSFSQCGTPLVGPTSAGRSCGGGLFNVIFKANRKLEQNESINCVIKGQGFCGYSGYPCDGAYKERSCGIGPGLSQCGVSGLDCSCKPFSYSCSGTANASGRFENVTNAGSETVEIFLPPPQSTQPTTTAPTPTPVPTSQSKPTKTPTPTTTPTSSPSLTYTPTPTPTSPPQASNTPTPTPTSPPQASNTPTTTVTPTRIPTSTLTQTPTPTEIILAQITNIPSPTQESIVSPTIPSSGRISSVYTLIPILIIILSLIF